MFVTLQSCGNPDYDQDPDRKLFTSGATRLADVLTYEEASNVCRQFILDNNLGSGNWIGGKIYSDQEHLGHVSFNGKVWSVDGKEIKI